MWRGILFAILFLAGCVCLQHANADGMSVPLAIPQNSPGAAMSYPPQSGGSCTNVAFDATSNAAVSSNTGTTLTWTHTPVGTPTAVAVLIENYELPTSVASVTYGGVSMASAGAQVQVPGTQSDIYIYGLANPPSGAQSVVVNFSFIGSFTNAVAMTVTHSNTSTAFRNYNSSTVTSATSISNSVTSQNCDMAVDMVSDSGGLTLTPGGGQTSIFNIQYVRSSYIQASGSSATVSWAATGSDSFADAAVSFEHQ